MKKILLPVFACVMVMALFGVKSGAQTLVYYWSFNAPADTSHATGFAPDYSAPGAGAANFTFDASGCAWPTTAGCVDYTTGGSLNAQTPDTAAGNCLRLRTPADSIVFHMPTSGYTNVTFSYVEERSGSGPTHNAITYTLDGTNFLPVSGADANPADTGNYTAVTVTGWDLHTFSFSGDMATNNNPNFAVKIAYVPSSDWAGAGNDRFDNVVMTGVPTTGITSVTPGQSNYILYPNPVNDHLEIKAQMDGEKSVRILNSIGQLVSETKSVGSHISVSTIALTPGMYTLQVLENTNGQLSTMKFTKQ